MKKAKNIKGAKDAPKERMAGVTIETPDYPFFARYHQFTAHKGGKRIGHVFAYLISDVVIGGKDRYYIYVHDLKVDEAARGQGVGRRLMEEVLRLAKKDGCYKVVANSHRKRRAAWALYKGMGFVSHGREFRLDP